MLASAGMLCLLAHPAQAQTPATEQTQPTRSSDGAPVEPIISDEEFDASIPPIDESAPLGSVQAWEAEADRRAASTGRDASVSAEPTASEQSTADEGLPAPPELDEELDRPLTPLNAFDVETFDESQYTEADEGPAPSLRYSYKIEGLSALDGAGPVLPVDGKDIVSQFKSLSALEDGDGKADNGAMINARLEEDQKLLVDILSSQGFFDATVRGSLELPEQDSKGPITVILQATPGPRYHLGEIRFDAPPVQPEDLITRAFRPRSGDPIVAERILGAEANIAVTLPENGYPFVNVGQRDIVLDPETEAGDYTLPITPGPRSSFGDIVVEGEKPVFEADHIQKIARFRKGELYDSRKIDDLRQALIATGLLSVGSVTPRPSGEPAGDGTDYATLIVNQEAGPARTLAAQAGYGTGQGVKVEGSWTHRNMFPPEGALIVQGTAGTLEQGLGVSFRRSNAGKRDRSVELGIDARHSNFDAFEAFTGRLYGRIAYESTPIWQKRLTYNFGFELLGSNEQDYNFDAGELRRRTYYVAALPGQVTFDTSNSLLDPTRGFRISAWLSPEASLGSGAQTYARALLEGTGYYPVSDGFVLAGRARVGMIGGAAREQIAPSRRFYGGGGGSVRGFGYQELGPKDPDARPIGGRSLVEAAAEVRYRFGDYGIVGFIDGGQVYTSQVPRFDDWRFGVGIGGRFYTNFGPMRLDVATPINRQPGESRISVYVSIGQAF
ncbi:translocation and assembly module TamA [Sphingobium sp. B2D3A]|uniref:autotransporter assembly complex protein TamA n=1 Tax=unclassified Sphingobium TaxID=2611147 RepID=UPI002225B63C|nr:MULTISPECIES: BamA/TamA family outer membrane protein [unclassified Sphingobium]MCW2337558.1 translocation and assembly module TamA [Sphingobium sp. B2D3A]MCW2384016.1 translocation and assembly module TamA [Sphingobium sp. B2D3D]